MDKPLTFELNWKKLHQSHHGVIISRLAMAINDINTGFELIEILKNQQYLSDFIESGGRMYLLRMTLSHLKEGVDLIAAANNVRELRDLVAAMPIERRKMWNRIVNLTSDPRKKDNEVSEEQLRYRRYVQRGRNWFGFHYDKDKTKEVLSWLATHEEVPIPLMGIETGTNKTRFLFADRLIDYGLYFTAWEQPEDADHEKAFEEILGWCRTQLESFVIAASDLVGVYCGIHCTEHDDDAILFENGQLRAKTQLPIQR